eukprot:s2315_g16.t1
MSGGTGSASTTAMDTNSTKDSYIPLFSGLPSDYKEWRKRITIYEIDKTGAFDKILKILDKAFEYDASVQLPNDFDRYFSQFQRRPGQSLLDYTTEHDHLYNKLGDHGVTLPTKVQGWYLLRKAGLTREQRQLVITQAPSLERNKVQEALFLILGQDHKTVAGHQPHHHGFRGKGRGYSVYYEDDQNDEPYGDDYPDDEGWEEGYYEGDDAASQVTSPLAESYADETYEDFDNDAAYYQTLEDTDPTEQAEEYDSAYATYLDARRRFNEIKLSRGFLPIVALTDGGSLAPGASPPSSSSPISPGRGKGKSKKGKNNSKSKGKGKQPDRKGRAKAAGSIGGPPTCLRCGQVGHMTYNCPVPRGNSPVKRKTAPTESTVGDVEHGHVIFTDNHGCERHDCAMLDPGASAFLSGYYGPFMRYMLQLKDTNYDIEQVQFMRCQRTFFFGGDASLECTWTVRLPLCIGGKYGYVQMYLLPGETPMLLGRPIMESLGLILDCRNRQIKLDEMPWQHAVVGAHGEYLISLLNEFDSGMWLHPPAFELMVPADGGTSGNFVDFQTFNQETKLFDVAQSTGIQAAASDTISSFYAGQDEQGASSKAVTPPAKRGMCTDDDADDGEEVEPAARPNLVKVNKHNLKPLQKMPGGVGLRAPPLPKQSNKAAAAAASSSGLQLQKLGPHLSWLKMPGFGDFCAPPPPVQPMCGPKLKKYACCCMPVQWYSRKRTWTMTYVEEF